MKAVAKALVGKVNPSGGLSDIILNDNFSNPAAMYWQVNEGFSSMYANASDMGLNSSQQYYGVYVEGVYVGYRYYDKKNLPVLFPLRARPELYGICLQRF